MLNTSLSIASLTAVICLESQLCPVSSDILHGICAHIARRFNYTHEDWNGAFKLLSSYPEDLVCAAYHHILRLHWPNCNALLASMIELMEPEFHYRKLRYRLLLNQHA